MLSLHKVLTDGSVVHEQFSKAAWEAAMRDPTVKWRWGHPTDQCFDLFAGPKRTGEQPPSPPPLPKQGVGWPPDGPALWPELLRDMTTLGIDDARQALSAPRKELPEQETLPLTDEDGQWSLGF